MKSKESYSRRIGLHKDRSSQQFQTKVGSEDIKSGFRTTNAAQPEKNALDAVYECLGAVKRIWGWILKKPWLQNFRYSNSGILGDPGADRGAGGKLGRAETTAEGHMFCSWVSEDGHLGVLLAGSLAWRHQQSSVLLPTHPKQSGIGRLEKTNLWSVKICRRARSECVII